VTVADQKIFVPVNWYRTIHDLFLTKKKAPQDPESHWQSVFADSLCVHLFSSRTNHLPVTGDPSRSAYAYLGPQYCPLSYPFVVTGDMRKPLIDALYLEE